MAFQSVPETAEVVIRYTMNGESMVNVVHGRIVGGYTLGLLQQLADAVDVAVGLNFKPIQTFDAVYNDTTVRGLEFINDQVAIANVNAGAGSILTAGLPGNATISIKKGSSQTGRSARGRLYWIAMPRDNLAANDNQFQALDVVAVVAAVDAIRIAITGTPWSPVIVSRFSLGLKRPTGVTFFWTTTNAVNDNVDSARGRLQA